MNPDSITSSLRYQDAHWRLIEEAAAIDFYGLILDTNQETDNELSQKKWAGFLPITWCVCVHDSPGNPCPCDGPIIWIPRDKVIRIEPSGRQSREGLSVSRFLVHREAHLIVEQASSMPVQAFVKRYASSAAQTPTHFPSAVPVGRPAGWPAYYPWPPTNSGPVIPAPSQTTHESGILWYEIQATPETRSGNLVAFDTNGKEIARHLTQMISDNELRFAVSAQGMRIAGGIIINRCSAGVLEIKGQVDGQEFLISCRAGEATCTEASRRPCLDVAQLQTLKQWGRLAEPLMSLAAATGGTQATKSCFSCWLLSAGVSVAGGCCLTGNPACCATLGIAGSSYLDGCIGACA